MDVRVERTRRALQEALFALAREQPLEELTVADITLRARLSVWLYLHVPLTVLLLVALLAHILSVFLLW